MLLLCRQLSFAAAPPGIGALRERVSARGAWRCTEVLQVARVSNAATAVLSYMQTAVPVLHRALARGQHLSHGRGRFDPGATMFRRSSPLHATLLMAGLALWPIGAWFRQRRIERRQRSSIAKPTELTTWEGEGGALPGTGSQIGPEPVKS
jgi:hypothetical protein